MMNYAQEQMYTSVNSAFESSQKISYNLPLDLKSESSPE